MIVLHRAGVGSLEKGADAATIGPFARGTTSPAHTYHYGLIITIKSKDMSNMNANHAHNRLEYDISVFQRQLGAYKGPASVS